MKSFYEPTQEQLTALGGPWSCSYSGGKDSTSLVTWIEWLRRSGWITVERPQLVRSDTTVEDQLLVGIAEEMSEMLRGSGWECKTVVPKINEKLYNRILGIGNTPVHPGIASMRWCTRSTKIDPMERWRKDHASGLTLTGLRLGESAMRDGKIKKHGCAAGGECGIPDPSERTYSPLLHWTTCMVIDWLTGTVGRAVRETMMDVFAMTQKLAALYNFKVASGGFGLTEPQIISAARFGCIGCPAISATKAPPAAVIVRNGRRSPLNELYSIWHCARQSKNRLWNAKKVKKQFGPIKMEVRKQLFDRVMGIQQRAGIVLITPEDEAFIRQCWADKVYPRGWSEADEANPHPPILPNFQDG